MKQALVVLAMVLLFPLTASATWYLACDIPTDSATGSQVRIDNSSIVDGLFQVSSDGQSLLLLDLTTYSNGIGHVFEARFTGAGVLPSPWSIPFMPGVLTAPVLKLIHQ